MMNIGLDMMGGDFAPLEAVKGILLFLNEPGTAIQLTLIGDEVEVKIAAGGRRHNPVYPVNRCGV